MLALGRLGNEAREEGRKGELGYEAGLEMWNVEGALGSLAHEVRYLLSLGDS